MTAGADRSLCGPLPLPLRQSGPAFVLHFTGHGGDALSGFSAAALLREDAYIS